MSAAPIRVLIVDDTADIRMLLRAALSALGGFEVVGEAENGEEGVREAATLRPDVVLLDLAMPVMDGLQATPLIRECSPTSHVVILSGFSRDRLGEEARTLGADAYIEKGTSPTEIARLLREVCSAPVSAMPTPRPTEPEDEQDPQLPWRRRIALAVEHVKDLASAFRSFGREVATEVPFDGSGFAVAGDDGYRMAALCGDIEGRIPVGTILPVQGSLAAALDDGRSVVISDTSTTREPADGYLLTRGVRSYAAVPVIAAGRAQAVIGFSSDDPDAFGGRSLGMLEEAVREAAAPLYMLYCLDRRASLEKQIASADEHRLEWNRVVRHDLRSPLTVIGGFAHAMRTSWDEIADEKKLEFVDAILRGAAAMTKLLADLEIVDGGADCGEAPHAIDLGRIVQQTASDLVGGHGRMIVTHIPEDLPPAMSREDAQRRVVSNLLENALKFSPAEQPVEVTISVEGPMLQVSVTDYGTGIDPEDQPKLFQKFVRARQSHDGPRVNGTGLGLFICRSLVERDGGRIWLESEPSAGSTFTYTVPAA